MNQTSSLCLMISLLMVSTDDAGEPHTKVVRAISDAKEAEGTCQALNTEADRMAGKLDAISDLLDNWSEGNPYPTDGTDEERGNRQAAYDAEEKRLRLIILGAEKAAELPRFAGDLPHYWIQQVKLD
jgi:hypothetical protein